MPHSDAHDPPRCAACHEPLLATDRFCVACGAAVAATPAPAPAPATPIAAAPAFRFSRRAPSAPVVRPSAPAPPATPAAATPAAGPPGAGAPAASRPKPSVPPTPPPDRVLEELRRATLGIYDVAGLLGRGGMAIVYLAHELALDRREAIKVLAPWLADTEGAVPRFKREARTAAQLQHHKHIIPVYRIGQTEDLVWFSMMYVGGGSLDGVLRVAGPLPVGLALTLLGQVGSALSVAHRAGIVHRDVKPANILLHEGGWAMMGDFGIAKVTQDRKLTMTGATVGTPTYMSPEQCRGSEATTAASDQYALGVVAYEMLTGRVPFEGESSYALMRAHLEEQPRPLRELRPDCPAEVEAAVLRMLAKQPGERWPSLDDAMLALTGTLYPALGTEAERQQLIAWARTAGAPLSGGFPTPMSPHPASRSQPALPHDA